MSNNNIYKVHHQYSVVLLLSVNPDAFQRLFQFINIILGFFFFLEGTEKNTRAKNNKKQVLIFCRKKYTHTGRKHMTNC